MAVKVLMPRLGETMDEGTILTWLKKEGDPVQRGESLFVVETDKVTMEVESFNSGILLKIIVSEGTTVPVGDIVGIIGEADEEASFAKVF